ncbi:MAG: selenide, water dikinase SelD [Bacteroidales bacterium]|nr:selenide, water dikinase SelD [Bacteroidales bacterium]
MNEIKLTQYSHGAGCGCKIAPKLLSTLLKSELSPIEYPELMVGNAECDDAAVYDLQNGTALISTTDFFMPIVDDPFTFGKIAAANAISDIYAMGGKPLMAIAILGWPVKVLPVDVAAKVLDGGRDTCREAGIPLAGGHSIDSPEPIFGLAVTGIATTEHIKQNSTATEGCRLMLTKPLGVGALSTAQKKGKLKPEHAHIAPASMMKLNSIGQRLADIKEVRAMTDVTGFGLIGHLTELCRGSHLSAELEYDAIPVFPEALEYIKEDCIPGGTFNNWKFYGPNVSLSREEDRFILCDPQTSGGLLIAVEEDAVEKVSALLNEEGIEARVFGKLLSQQVPMITVR